MHANQPRSTTCKYCSMCSTSAATVRAVPHTRECPASHSHAGATEPGLAHAIPLATYLLQQQGAGSDVVMPAIVQCLSSPDIGRGVFSQNKNLEKRCSIMLELMDKCSRYDRCSDEQPGATRQPHNTGCWLSNTSARRIVSSSAQQPCDWQTTWCSRRVAGWMCTETHAL